MCLQRYLTNGQKQIIESNCDFVTCEDLQMLGLKLRKEFLASRLRGTAIKLTDKNNSGAIQVAPEHFLNITYPTHDLIRSMKAVGGSDGRPVVVFGERGLGKSHLMAVLYHSTNDPKFTKEWLNSWSSELENPEIGEIVLREDMMVIGESLHHHNYKFLWDILFEKHPKGEFLRGKWEEKGTAVPASDIVIEMVNHKPILLILDEYQTWYDSLEDKSSHPHKQQAFNFIQILTDVSKSHPDKLILVVSVRNGESDAYKQIHRENPILIDFKSGGNPERIQKDRRNMLLYRLFENRLQISETEINNLIDVHFSEYINLMRISSNEREKKHNEFLDSWPFAPHLLRLLEDQVLIATDAQETRDLIRILANLYKKCGNETPILTAADFSLDENDPGIVALLSSVANEHHRSLRDKALRNLTSVIDAIPNSDAEVPNLQGLMGALWLRSISVDSRGAEVSELHLDITKEYKIDQNSFQVEINTIVENSFNIHKNQSRYVFKEEENPQAKVMALAKNDKIFEDRRDYLRLANEIQYVIAGEGEYSSKYRIIVLQARNWMTEPWTDFDDNFHPNQWDERIPIIVIPESKSQLNEELGRWLKDHVNKHRNTIRFLLPASNLSDGLYKRQFLVLVRAMLLADEWGNQNSEYRRLFAKYKNELHGELKKCFDKFAILKRWDFREPKNCEFHIELVRTNAEKIPDAIEKSIIEDLFVPEDFESYVLDAAEASKTVANIIEDLQEPQSSDQDCIPWLGETLLKEKILRICSQGKIVINVRGSDKLQMNPGEPVDVAWQRLKSKLPITGRQLSEVIISKNENIPISGGPLSKNEVEYNDSSLETGSIANGTADESMKKIESTETLTEKEVNHWSTEKFSENSPLNLIGKLEENKIGVATPIKDVNLRVDAKNGSQLVHVLKSLPDEIKFELSLDVGEM